MREGASPRRPSRLRTNATTQPWAGPCSEREKRERGLLLSRRDEKKKFQKDSNLILPPSHRRTEKGRGKRKRRRIETEEAGSAVSQHEAEI